MKKILLIASLMMLFNLNIDAQRLSQKDNALEVENTLFAVQDTATGIYSWKKFSLANLRNWLGVNKDYFRVYADSTKVSNKLSINDGFNVKWWNPTNHLELSVNGGGVFGRTDSRNSFYLGSHGAEARMYIYSQNNNNNSVLGGDFVHIIDTQNIEKIDKTEAIHDIVMQFYDFGDNTQSLTWPPLSVVPNVKLFTIRNSTERDGYISVWHDSTKINNKAILADGLEVTGSITTTELVVPTLSYSPSNSSDLQSEAASAAVGAIWQRDVSGTIYLFVKKDASTLHRIAFASF